MHVDLILLRVALVLALWAVPLAVGLIAHLGDWPRPAMASIKSRPAMETPPVDKAA